MSIPTTRLDERCPDSGGMITTLRLTTDAVQAAQCRAFDWDHFEAGIAMRSAVLLCFTLKRSRVCTIAIPIGCRRDIAHDKDAWRKKNGWADRLLLPQYSHLSAGKT